MTVERTLLVDTPPLLHAPRGAGVDGAEGSSRLGGGSRTAELALVEWVLSVSDVVVVLSDGMDDTHMWCVKHNPKP